MIEKILNTKDHQNLAKEANLIRKHMEDLQRQLNTLVDELKHPKDEMAKQDMDLLLRVIVWCDFSGENA